SAIWPRRARASAPSARGGRPASRPRISGGGRPRPSRGARRGRAGGKGSSTVKPHRGGADDRALLGIDVLLVVPEAAARAAGEGSKERVDRREPADAARVEIARDVPPEALGVDARRVIERLAI